VSLVYRVAEEWRPALLEFLRRAIPFYERPGGVRVALYDSVDEPGLVLELVAYASEAEYAADQERVERDPEMRAVLAEWRRLLDGPPEVRRLRPLRLAGEEPAMRPAAPEAIEPVWRERWGVPVVSIAHEYRPEDVEGLLLVAPGGRVLGLVTWAVAGESGESGEIVTLDAFEEGRGHGGRLLGAAEAELGRRGVARVRIVTSNDNPRALGMYVRRGYRLVRLHVDAVCEMRRRKPRVPELGRGGIPLRDLWEFEKHLRPGP
jgi:ribosomal protein S18 acetylase RimI-like enzyme